MEARVAAVLKLQSTYRGVRARDAAQEKARVQWLMLHLEAGDWQEAEDLALSWEELSMVAAAKQEADLVLSQAVSPQSSRYLAELPPPTSEAASAVQPEWSEATQADLNLIQKEEEAAAVSPSMAVPHDACVHHVMTHRACTRFPFAGHSAPAVQCNAGCTDDAFQQHASRNESL